MRANDWVESVGVRPIAIAHEMRFAQSAIARRDLALGEKASPDAVVVESIDGDGRPTFIPALGREAPDGWSEQLRRALVRAARALGFRIEDETATIADFDGTLSHEEFEARVQEYIGDAERMVREARAELEFREKEIATLMKRRKRSR